MAEFCLLFIKSYVICLINFVVCVHASLLSLLLMGCIFLNENEIKDNSW